MSFALAGSIESISAGNATKKVLHTLNIVAFLIYGAWMISHSSFIYVILHYVPTMSAMFRMGIPPVGQMRWPSVIALPRAGKAAEGARLSRHRR